MPAASVINLRVSGEQKALIDHAAEALGKTRTAFILEHALRGAEDALLDRVEFRLDGQQWAEFNELLDKAPNADQLEKLQKLFTLPSPWRD